MAAMAASQPMMDGPNLTVGRSNRRPVWLLWPIVSTFGAILAALVSWQIQSLAGVGPTPGERGGAFVQTVVSALILSACQWLLLRRYRLDVFWWVPASVMGNIVAAAVVVPGVMSLVPYQEISPLNADRVMLIGGLALASTGLGIGTAQAIVLRRLIGNLALAWIPASVLGGALAGALTAGLSRSFFSAVWLYGMPVFALVFIASAIGGLLASIVQTPIVARFLR